LRPQPVLFSFPAIFMAHSNPIFSRRRFLATGAALGASASLGAVPAPSSAAGASPPPPPTSPRYRVGVCDWMILKRQRLGAFSRAAEIGADGVELDMGGLGNRPTFDSKLLDPIERRRFLEAAAEHRLEICSIAMSGFYAQDFATREVYPMVRDTLNTMNLMGVKVAFLPLGVQGDLVKFPEKRPAIIERLREAGRMAEAAGVVIGIETALDARGEVALLDEIGSPAIQSYFNFANPLQAGRDLLAELRVLGRERICQIHCTDEDKVWLEHNERLDLRAAKAVLDAMGWSGWLVLERSRDARNPRDVVGNFGANARYVKKIFQAED
jgi:L-ribulose-5-phosphate 3-epimerase